MYIQHIGKLLPTRLMFCLDLSSFSSTYSYVAYCFYWIKGRKIELIYIFVTSWLPMAYKMFYWTMIPPIMHALHTAILTTRVWPVQLIATQQLSQVYKLNNQTYEEQCKRQIRILKLYYGNHLQLSLDQVWEDLANSTLTETSKTFSLEL